jgi:hypothetical protein
MDIITRNRINLKTLYAATGSLDIVLRDRINLKIKDAVDMQHRLGPQGQNKPSNKVCCRHAA